MLRLFLDSDNKRDYSRTYSVGKNNRRTSHCRAFEDSINDYAREMSFSNKYITQDAVDKLISSSHERDILFELGRRSYNSGRKSPEKSAYLDVDEDIIEKLTNACSLSEREPQSKLIPVYQQVFETYDDGTKYAGEKFLGKRHGKGKYYYNEGYVYDGDWDQDQMTGYGVLWLTEDFIWYEGEWLNNSFHGRGILYNPSTEELDVDKYYAEDFIEVDNGWIKYEGLFFKGSKHGFGCLYLENGDLFVGGFRFNHPEGRGSYTKQQDQVIVGFWDGGRLIEIF